MIKSLKVKSLVLVKSKSEIICQCFTDPAIIPIHFILPAIILVKCLPNERIYSTDCFH